MTNAAFELTPQQIHYFKTFGFLHFPGLVADRLEGILGGFDEVWAAHGNPHEDEKRTSLQRFIEQSAELASLLDDPRIHGLTAGLLGDDYNYIGSDGNYYADDTQWHYDSVYEGLTFLKVAFYLDPLTRDTGALRVIPGGHNETDIFAQQLWHLYPAPTIPEKWGVSAAEIPAFAIETQPGDVVCFNHKMLHAAFGGGRRRRMFTLNYSQHIPADRIDILRGYMERFGHPFYDETLLATAGPERLRHLEQVLALEQELRVATP